MTKLTDYDTYDFANRRHIGPSPEEMAEMLEVVGAADLDTLIDETVPRSIRQSEPLPWPQMTEHAILSRMRELAAKNRITVSMIGQGYSDTVTPPAIQRNVLENPAWYTAYTPYQPEIAQGRLEALLNFQTMVSDLTGLPVANASLLDEATACAEAMVMAQRVGKSKAAAFFVDANCHPQNIAVMQTRAEPLGIELIVGDVSDLDADAVFGAIFQYPDTHGGLGDLSAQMDALHKAKAIGIVATDLLALCLLKEPGAMGADIAVGSAQRFGVPLGYGGPHAAFFACAETHKRSMPGRIVGVSVDALGNKAYRLALQTREQHIRREKATSNVCTAQALLAVMASFFAVFHGPRGLRHIATHVHAHAVALRDALAEAGFAVSDGPIFDTFTVTSDRRDALWQAARDAGITLRRIGDDRLGIACDEMTDGAVLERLLSAFGVEAAPELRVDLPDALARETDYLTHPIFHMNRAEAEMMRYMRRLADRDLALDRAMIPLGSCTMKLNAAVEMMPVTFPEFGRLHPFAPREDAAGYVEMIEELKDRLCVITGYDAMSMQPNSGAQGEYAGLLTIAAWHRARGEDNRRICLIPTSAHGTNPASAMMAGMKVVIVKAAANGDVDIDDFRAKAKAAGDDLAACMITYPSTHGVFEDTVREVCEITHQHGGQVYLDGANLNAMVGLSKPGEIGADVSHLNLHKTFCIPHGGGGPGMGPIGVKAHLAPHLPGHPEEGTEAPVSAAPFGSASILPISYSYVMMMGGAGLTQATKVAILSANYVAARLKGAYGVLFAGRNGRIAHECILDTRPFKESAGVTVDDVAKRLIDNGFHAPTMSWPVAGTLMVEPTESEPKPELDRFVNAMLAIREEIAKIEQGQMDADNNPLKNAPHTMEDLVRDWDRPYSREAACFPAGAFRVDKYWPPVNRVDNVAGDRNLVCTCPPVESYLEAAE
ncbi:Glycine dehydrogenase [decarboxylating] [Jannaschia seosinensis]|uniref:Glycine dehydrogenase (decarboxylating) n=1 Tax=Jannaschia seosinensis TaxID=313367 RepID=A0A0M7BBL9_9RHOB|nr:aminomethyl-transferring glycine dehydrogenase [Jannaschia seosinensis]CUH40130.1 Glycine dehydrogenase [decarboxylating] [Jannaschia seosinensis]